MQQEKSDYDNLLGRLLNVHLQATADYWTCGDEMHFSTSYIKGLLQKSVSNTDRYHFTWVGSEDGKYSHFLKVNRNRLHTCDSLARRNVPVLSLLCKFCDHDDDNGDHVFLRC